MTTCQACGAQNDPQSEFCAHCDEFIGWARGGSSSAPAGSPDPGAGTTAPVASGDDELWSRLSARRTDGPTTLSEEAREPAARQPVEDEPEAARPTTPRPDSPEPELLEPDSQPVIELPTAASDVLRTIEAGSRLADAAERPDLSEALDRTQARLMSAKATVVLLGEFKRGKSTLINAMLHAAVCPVDADIVTGVPTLIGYADALTATVYSQDADSGDQVARPVSLGELRGIVAAPTGPPHGERSVEIGLPHRLLRTGLRLVDTPGVGGLESIHGQLALGMLAVADGVVFVTDAAQELTAPELEYLRTVVERCPRTIVVVTKIDLHAHWRRIVELNREHLRAAGLDLPFVPVSSFLRLRAATDPSLNPESGFTELVSALALHIVRPATRKAAAVAADEVDYVVEQLAEQNDAEKAVIQRSDKAAQVIDGLRRSQQAAARLGTGSASWQQVLSDGIQDLGADVRHDLEERMRAVLHDVESVIDESDPRETWSHTEGWLRTQVAKVVVDNRDMLLSRADELAAAVAARFELDSGRGFQVRLGDIEDVQSSLPEIEELSTTAPGRLTFAMLATRSTLYIPMVVFSIFNIPTLLPLSLIGGAIAVGLGLGIGRKFLRDEATRQRDLRRQQAKGVARSYIENVAFVLRKDTMDALRATERGLRDEFQTRARDLHTSSTLALRAVERTATMSASQQSSRARTLSDAAEKINHVRLTTEQIRRSAGQPERAR